MSDWRTKQNVQNQPVGFSCALPLFSLSEVQTFQEQTEALFGNLMDEGQSVLSVNLSVCLCLSGSVGDLLYIYRIDGSFVGFPMSAVVLCVWAQTLLPG